MRIVVCLVVAATIAAPQPRSRTRRKLESARGPVTTVVIERVEPATEN